MLATHFRFDANSDLLEIGPGYGRILQSILDKGLPFRSYTGIDLSEANVQFLAEAFSDDRISFICGDAETHCFETSFDAVFSAATFKHIHPTIGVLVENLRRAMNPSGQLVFDFIPGERADFDRHTWMRYYQPDEIVSMLEPLGFRVAFDQVIHDVDLIRTVAIASLVEGPPMSETAKHRHVTTPYCCGNGLDLGSGGDPVVPSAIQVDLPEGPQYGQSDAAIQWRGDARSLPWVADETMDYLYSSHLIEDFQEWDTVLREWQRVVKRGGYIVILVPDKDRYVGHNTAHVHEGHPGELSSYFPEREWNVITDDFAADNDYSIIFVAQKTPVDIRGLLPASETEDDENRRGMTPCNDYYALPDLSGKRVLEVGCNVGRLARHILRQSPDVYLGLDEQDQMPRNHLPALDGHFRVADIERRDTLPFDQTWDIVICFDVLYHLRSPLVALQNLRDLTSGCLVLGSSVVPTGAHRSSSWPIRPHHVVGPFLKFEPGYFGDPSNYFYPTLEFLERAFEWLGFQSFELAHLYPDSAVHNVFHDRACYHCYL